MAAKRPGIPSPPTYLSSSATQITIQWQDVKDNGGSIITAYNVYADTGDLTVSTFNLVGSTPDL